MIFRQVGRSVRCTGDGFVHLFGEGTKAENGQNGSGHARVTGG